jgi:hypothetical protein
MARSPIAIQTPKPGAAADIIKKLADTNNDVAT